VGSFRRAQVEDIPRFYDWRVRQQSQPFYVGPDLTYMKHREWMIPRLRNPLVKLLVWSEKGKPAGILRIDSNGEFDYHADSDWVAYRMLRGALRYAPLYGGRLKISLDDADPRLGQLFEAGFVGSPAVSLSWRG
jgi:hypothetical protein